MHEYPVEITKWLADEPQPGWIEAELVDADGEHWAFHDKPPIFCDRPIGASTSYPVNGLARCDIVEELGTTARIRLIDAATEDGTRTFVVNRSTVAIARDIGQR
jgi:hypothetical protein